MPRGTSRPRDHPRYAARGPRYPRGLPCRAQHGVALVLVLWLVALLTVIAGSHTYNARTETTLAHHQLEAARARALAEAGIHRAVLELFNPDAQLAWPAYGAPRMVNLPGGDVQVALRNAAGLVDLNGATPELLAALLSVLALEPGESEALRDAILDWRDPDDLLHLEGAEDADYRRAGLPYGAADGPFGSVEELRYVLGMTPERFAMLAPLVTVHSGLGFVNTAYAPEELLKVLPGADADQVEAIMAQRTQEPEETDALSGVTGRDASGRQSAAFRITAEAARAGGTVARIEATVLRTRDRQRPFVFVAWRS